MGLFDVFKSKQNTGADNKLAQSDGAKTEWAGKLKSFWDMEDEQKWELSEGLMNDVATHFENAKVKKDVDDDKVGMRTRVGELPVKVEFDATAGWVSIDMKCPNRVGFLSLERDLEKLPRQKDADDDWADDDEVRLFVGKGVFIEGDEDDVNEHLTTLKSLPPEFGDKLISKMETMKLSRFFATQDSLSIGYDDNHYEMADPISEIKNGVEVLTSAAAAFASGSRDMASEPRVRISGNVMINGQLVTPNVGGAPPLQQFARTTCKYCSTIYLLGPSSRCPNCGAATAA